MKNELSESPSPTRRFVSMYLIIFIITKEDLIHTYIRWFMQGEQKKMLAGSRNFKRRLSTQIAMGSTVCVELTDNIDCHAGTCLPSMYHFFCVV